MSKDLDVNKLMANVKALTVENENLLSENEEYKAKVAKLESDIEGYKRSIEELHSDSMITERALHDAVKKSNEYQREIEKLRGRINSSLTVEELLRHLSKGGGNSVVIGIK